VNRRRSQLQAYFAGILDGEGHISISQHGTTYKGAISVGMDDPQAVMLLWREYPEALVTYRPHKPSDPNSKFEWRIAFNHYKGYQFLEDVLPFLVVKYEQAKVLRSFLAHRRRDHSLATRFQRPGGRCERCEKLRLSLLAIRARTKGMNSVNALLEHEMREYRAKPEEVAEDVSVITAKMRELQDGVETRVSESNKPISVPEQEIVQHAA